MLDFPVRLSLHPVVVRSQINPDPRYKGFMGKSNILETAGGGIGVIMNGADRGLINWIATPRNRKLRHGALPRTRARKQPKWHAQDHRHQKRQ